MPYVITFNDEPGTKEKKRSVRPTHLEYVARNADRIIVSGGFFPDGDDFPNGGLIMLDVDSKKDAVDYIESDPFFLAGTFTTYSIQRFRTFIFDRECVAGSNATPVREASGDSGGRRPDGPRPLS